MALSSTTVRAVYSGTGSQVEFTIPGSIIEDDSAEVLVYVRDESQTVAVETLKTEGPDYTLTGRADVNSQHTTVTFKTAPASTDKVLVIYQMPLTQTLDAKENGEFKLTEHETAYDRIVRMVQLLDEKLDRALLLPVTSSTSDLELPEPSAGKILIWNSTATALENQDSAQYLTGNLNEFSVTDGQSAADLTNETVDGTVYTSAIYEYEIIRGTTVMTTGRFALQYLNSTWRLEDGGGEGSASGVTFSVSQSGTTAQLRAALDSGAGNGTIKLKKHLFTA